MTNVAVLGLGAMGSRMAARLAEAGHRVTVWNRSSAIASDLAEEVRGIAAAASASDAVADSDVAIAMLTDDDASRSVWIEHGVLEALPERAVAVEASTVSSAWVGDLAARADRAGRAFAAAPVVGSRPQAEAGALLSIVGASPVVVDRVQPVVEAYSGKVHAVPTPADAATLKLVINGLFAAQVGLFGEIAGVVERSTLPTDETMELLSNLPITAPGLARIIGLYAERRFEPNFPIGLVAKDLGYLERIARELEASSPLIETSRRVFEEAVEASLGELDVSGIAARYLG